MKKTIAILLVLLLLLMTACAKTEPQPAEPAPSEGNETATETPDTLGQKYLAAFNSSSADSAEAVTDELVDLFDNGLVKMAVGPGYLDGFDADITKFSSGFKFSPMIGSIPFVGYVLESDDPEALLDEMTGYANTAWNICTEADETVSGIRGNLVFFLMCSNEE